MKLTPQQQKSALELGTMIYGVIQQHPTCEIKLNVKNSALAMQYTPQALNFKLTSLKDVCIVEETAIDNSETN